MIISEETAFEIAGKLLDIEAVRLRPDHPFTWASGWQSPIYCDNRISLSFPAIRNRIKGILAQGISKNFSNIGLIAGVATAGIAHGALAADELNLPFAYVRSAAKKHGMGNKIEGKVNAGDRVVVVEDLISTGGSSLAAVEALREQGADVLGLVAIFTYGFEQANQAFENAGCAFYTISDYAALIGVAQQRHLVSTEQMESLKHWRTDPARWPSVSSL